jgi:hypothetical protein
VRFAVPEDRAGDVAVKGCVSVAIASPAVVAPAQIATVAPQVDAASRMIVVEAELHVPPQWRGRMPAGAVAEVSPAPCNGAEP